MATLPFAKTGKHLKYLTYRKILYHRFFVSLLLFILVSLVVIIVINGFTGNSSRTDRYEPVNLNFRDLEIVKLKSDLPSSRERQQNCTHWECLNVYKCGRGGYDKITIYIYPLRKYVAEDGSSISHFSKEFYSILNVIRKSKYYTPNPDEACLFIPSIDTLNQNTFSSGHVGQALYMLEQ